MNTEQAYSLGYDDFNNGNMGGNLFHPNSYLYKEYERGFNTAYFRNLKALLIYERRQKEKQA